MHLVFKDVFKKGKNTNLVKLSLAACVLGLAGPQLYFVISLWVSRVSKYPKKCLKDLTTFFMSTWWGDSKNMEEIKFSPWLLEGRPRQCQNVLPYWLNWLCYFAGSLKSHRENSISFIFLESSNQVDMKNVVKFSKHFFGYFNTLETHSDFVIILRAHARAYVARISAQ
jgi:hypothetical protein